MQINFRQGIVESQRGITEFIEYKKSNNSVSLNTNKKPLVLNFAHGSSNYLVTIQVSYSIAWDELPETCWLYWDIDLLTGEIAYGSTEFNAGFGTDFPLSPDDDTHFFNTANFKMYVFETEKWIEKVRLFAGKLENGVLNPYATGSQVNYRLPCIAGEIVFDHKNRVIRRFQDDGSFELITTTSFNNSQHTNLTNHIFKGVQLRGVANENMNKFLCVNWASHNRLKLADPSDERPAFAMVAVDAITDELVSIITHGFVRNTNWQWTNKPNTLLFLGSNGTITTQVPQTNSLQNIGYIVSPLVIYLKFDRQIFINPMELSPTPTPTPTITPSASRTPSVTPTVTASTTPSHTPSVTPTMTRTPTRTPTMTNTPTFTPVSTQTPTPSNTASISPTPTQTLTPTLTPTVTSTPATTVSNTPTQAPTNTQTRTPTPTPSNTPTPDPSLTMTPTPTLTPTLTPTVTETATITPTPSNTPTLTPTVTETVTVTPTPSPTPTITPTLTMTPT